MANPMTALIDQIIATRSAQLEQQIAQELQRTGEPLEHFKLFYYPDGLVELKQVTRDELWLDWLERNH